MSLSISEYLNNTYQTAQTSSTEKSSQKEAETGKAKQSAVSSSLDQVNLGEDGVAVTQVSRMQGAGQTNTQQNSAVPHTDTVEISAEGKTASGQTASSTMADAYEYEPEDLSEYTDSELKQMYYRGDITLQEYEDETGETIE